MPPSVAKTSADLISTCTGQLVKVIMRLSLILRDTGLNCHKDAEQTEHCDEIRLKHVSSDYCSITTLDYLLVRQADMKGVKDSFERVFIPRSYISKRTGIIK